MASGYVEPPEGYSATTFVNPYHFSQYAYIWSELLGEAQTNLAAQGVTPDPNLYTWILGMIVRIWPGLTLVPPPYFSLYQVVLVNPQPVIVGPPVWGLQVYNPNLMAISVLDSTGIALIPPAVPAPARAPI